MKRFAVLGIAATLVVVLVIAIRVLATVPPLLVAQRVVDQIASWTGREVTFSGEPDFSLYPRVGVRINDVTLAAPKGSDAPPLLIADSLTARPRLLPLLIGRIEFDEFRLVNPTINLNVDSAGEASWLDGKRLPAELRIGRFVMTGGTVIYDNAITAKREVFDGIEIDISWPNLRAAASGAGIFRWRDQAVEVNGAVVAPFDLLQGSGSSLRLSLNTVPIRASFNGRLQRLDRLQLEGDARISTPSLRRAIDWLSLAPIDEDGPTFGAASIEGSVNWIGPAIAFSGARIEIDGNAAEGALSANLSGPRPSIHGTLAFSTLDLTPYFEATSAKIVRLGPTALFSRAALPFAGFCDADLRVSANELRVGSARIAKAAASAEVRNDSFAIELADGQLHGGKVQGSLRGRLSAGSLQTVANASFAGVAAGATLAELTGAQPISGSATGTIAVSAEGPNWISLANGASGSIAVRVANGSIAGVDVSELSDLYADPLAETVEPAEVATPFSALRATFRLASGVASTDNLWAEGDGYTAILSGWGSLLRGTVSGKASVSVSGTRDIPISISGDFWLPVMSIIRPTPGGSGRSTPREPPGSPGARTDG